MLVVYTYGDWGPVEVIVIADSQPARAAVARHDLPEHQCCSGRAHDPTGAVHWWVSRPVLQWVSTRHGAVHWWVSRPVLQWASTGHDTTSRRWRHRPSPTSNRTWCEARLDNQRVVSVILHVSASLPRTYRSDSRRKNRRRISKHEPQVRQERT